MSTRLTQHLPPLTLRTLWTLIVAGALALVAFDFFGQSLSPAFGYATLAPVPLANAVIAKVFGAGYRPGAEALHYLAGVLAYPAGWLLIARPVWKTYARKLPMVVPAVAYGIVLWVFALYVMAHLIAGNPPFLGWTGITWVALWGHILFALVAAYVMEPRLRRG